MKYGLSSDRMLGYLGKYMTEWIDAYPKKIKPFDNWIDQYFEKQKTFANKAMEKYNKDYCRYCRRPFSEYVVKTKDHVVPVSRGGLNTKENKVPCCSDCNSWKSDYTLDKFLDSVRTALRRITKRGKERPPYNESMLGYMISAIQKQMKEIKKNQNKVSEYKV